MRLFFIGWSGKEVGFLQAVKKMKDQGHEIPYWSCGTESRLGLDKSQFPGTVFHDISDALAGIPPKELSKENIFLLGMDLIEKFYETESAIMVMMDKKYEKLTVSERKHLYYHFLAYWHWVIDKFKPEAVIFPVAPHSVYDFVIYALANYFKIKTVMFIQSSVGDRMLAINGFKTGSAVLEEKMEINQNKKFSMGDLSMDFQDYYKAQVGELGKTPPSYMQYDLDQYSGLKLLIVKLKAVRDSLKRRDFLKLVATFLSTRLGQNPIKEYQCCQSLVNFQEKFIYAPLHYQPERTTSPDGGIFVDQLRMIDILSAALPLGWFLYVKEHPIQWLKRGPAFFGYRYSGYYRHIAKMKNVRLVAMTTPSYSLIRYSAAVATVSGTAGWEAVLRLKPVLTFGYPWYQQCQEIFKVNDFLSCKRAIDKIAGGFLPNEQSVINYLASLDMASFHGYVDESGKRISHISPEENALNIVRALTAELEKPL